ncbi:MAG: hypothetical protein WED11_06070 [Natronospirillum sp.]
MTTRLTRTSGPKKKAATETRQSLQSKIDAFLDDGGEIQQIPSGVSGQQSMAATKARPFAKKQTAEPTADAAPTTATDAK